MLILVNESLGESGSGTGTAHFYYSQCDNILLPSEAVTLKQPGVNKISHKP